MDDIEASRQGKIDAAFSGTGGAYLMKLLDLDQPTEKFIQ